MTKLVRFKVKTHKRRFKKVMKKVKLDKNLSFFIIDEKDFLKKLGIKSTQYNWIFNIQNYGDKIFIFMFDNLPKYKKIKRLK